jgi:hypothetical protein
MKGRFSANLYRTVVTLSLALLCIAISSCQSVKHVLVLRDAQESFSAASDELNKVTLSTLAVDSRKSPVDPSVEVTNPKLLALSSTEIYDLGTRFADVSNRLATLNENEQSALQQDKLYGTSMTLQLAAEWKASLLMQLAGDVPAPGSAGATGTLAEPPSFIDLRARAQAVKRAVEADKTPLFARDEAMLEAMEPLLAYDNAYVFGVRYAKEGRFEKSLPIGQRTATVKSVVEPMAQAEMELANLKLAKPAAHLTDYLLVSRFIMLRTADKLVFAADLVKRDEEGNLVLDETAAKEQFPILVARVTKMRSEFGAPNSALARALGQQRSSQEEWQRYLNVQLTVFWK